MKLKNKIYFYIGKAVTLPVLFLFFILIFTACTGNNDSFPKSAGIAFVSDQAALLSKAETNHIIQLAGALLKDMDIHIMVVVLKESPEDIDNKAAKLFQEYGIGRTTNGAKGVLFLIDPLGKQVRIEIGYDLEPIFTDGFTGYIERRQSDLRQASPYFLEKGRQGWMLDFVSMSKLIGFNHKNQWHLRQRNHKYMFGFKGIYFDKNGFPHN